MQEHQPKEHLPKEHLDNPSRKEPARKQHSLGKKETPPKRRSTRKRVRPRAPRDIEAAHVMVVRQKGGLTQIAVLESGKLVEYYVDAGRQSLVGNVYLGVVTAVLPSMEAAFVDIGHGKGGMLRVSELPQGGRGNQKTTIDKALKTGSTVMVQVIKDATGKKGPRLTGRVSLPGRHLVYTPLAAGLGVTKKLGDKERARLKTAMQEVGGVGGGFIVRTAADGQDAESLRRDAEFLQRQWAALVDRSSEGTSADLLLRQPSLVTRVTRDVFNPGFAEMAVEGADALEEVREYLCQVAPDLVARVVSWDGGDIFTEYGVDSQLSEALGRVVPLPSGGSLVFDYTEAMTVVDVNTGKFTGNGGTLEDTVTRNNLEAAEEVARQIRLRNISGIIVVDFVDMESARNQACVIEKLNESVRKDRVPMLVSEITSLGLVQITRKRTGENLKSLTAEPCSTCNGQGYLTESPNDPNGATGTSVKNLSRRNRVSSATTRHKASQEGAL